MMEWLLVAHLAVAIRRDGGDITELQMGPFPTQTQCETWLKSGHMLQLMAPGTQIKSAECVPQAKI